MPRNSESDFKKTLLSAFAILISAYDTMEDLRTDFPDARENLRKCIIELKTHSNLNEKIVRKMATILNFNRTYPVFEFVDKMKDVNMWLEESFKTVKSFYRY